MNIKVTIYIIQLNKIILLLKVKIKYDISIFKNEVNFSNLINFVFESFN